MGSIMSEHPFILVTVFPLSIGLAYMVYQLMNKMEPNDPILAPKCALITLIAVNVVGTFLLMALGF